MKKLLVILVLIALAFSATIQVSAQSGLHFSADLGLDLLPSSDDPV